MPNPAHKLGHIAFGVAVILFTSLGCVMAQETHPNDPLLGLPENWPNRIIIQGATTRLDINLSGGGAAILTRDDQVWRVVNAADCEPLQSALYAIQRLPPLQPGPLALQPAAPPGMDLPPTRKDGESWRISLPAYAPDRSPAYIEIIGLGAPYAVWADRMVAAVQSCGPPETLPQAQAD